jgi:hypothetical protein
MDIETAIGFVVSVPTTLAVTCATGLLHREAISHRIVWARPLPGLVGAQPSAKEARAEIGAAITCWLLLDDRLNLIGEASCRIVGVGIESWRTLGARLAARDLTVAAALPERTVIDGSIAIIVQLVADLLTVGVSVAMDVITVDRLSGNRFDVPVWLRTFTKITADRLVDKAVIV